MTLMNINEQGVKDTGHSISIESRTTELLIQDYPSFQVSDSVTVGFGFWPHNKHSYLQNSIKQFLEDTSNFCRPCFGVLFVGPLISRFWTSGDISSGLQSQSGQLGGGILVTCSLRFTSGAKRSVGVEPEMILRCSSMSERSIQPTEIFLF